MSVIVPIASPIQLFHDQKRDIPHIKESRASIYLRIAKEYGAECLVDLWKRTHKHLFRKRKYINESEEEGGDENSNGKRRRIDHVPESKPESKRHRCYDDDDLFDSHKIKRQRK